MWRRWILLPLFLCFLTPTLLATQDGAGQNPAAVALAHRVERLKASFLADDEAGVRAAAREVDLVRHLYGTLDLTPLVEGMVLFSLDQGRAGHVERGLKTLALLEGWSPQNPMLLSAKVGLLRQKGPAGYVQSLPEVVSLTQLRLNHPVHRWLFIVQHMAWLRLMAAALLWGWGLALVLRYRRVIRHQVEEWCGRMTGIGWLRASLAAMTLAAPVLVGLDPSICAMVWLVLLVPYMLGVELKYTVFVILLQLVHPLLAFLEPMAIKDPDPSIVALQAQAQANPVHWSAIKGLPPVDRRYLEGWSQLQNRDWAGAEQTFLELRPSHPHKGGVLNNLGVALFQQGRMDEAQAAFDQASLDLPGSAPILVNQSILAFSRLDTAKGEERQLRAQEAEPQVYAALKDAIQAQTQQRTYAVPLPDSPTRVEALRAYFGASEAVRLSERQRYALLAWILIPLAASAIFILRARQSMREAHPSQCIRCGEPFHTTDSPDPGVCTKCHHLFVMKDGLHNEARKAKVDGVGRFQGQQRWIHRVLLVVLPGCDLVFLGQTREGLLEFLFFTLAMGIVVGTGRTVRFPGEILPDPSTIWLPVGIGLLGVLFVRSWLKLVSGRN